LRVTARDGVLSRFVANDMGQVVRANAVDAVEPARVQARGKAPQIDWLRASVSPRETVVLPEAACKAAGLMVGRKASPGKRKVTKPR